MLLLFYVQNVMNEKKSEIYNFAKNRRGCASNVISSSRIRKHIASSKMVHGSVSLTARPYHGLMRTMKLKSSVGSVKKERKPTQCTHEMTAVMGCWKQNSFNDNLCSKEIEAFMLCVEKSRNTSKVVTQDRSGHTKYDVDELNSRMKAFVWPQ